MRIPPTLNACAYALANLGHQVYLNGDRGQVIDNLPVDGLLAYVFFNEEHESLEATFSLPGCVADDESARTLANILQRTSPGLCRFIIDAGQVRAKASLFLGTDPVVSQLQSWWRRSLGEVVQWWEQAHSYGVLGGDHTPPQAQMTFDDNTFVVNTSDPVVDGERCEPVTAERVAQAMSRLTGSVPPIRPADEGEVVEVTIAGRYVDIQVTNTEVCVTVGSAINAHGTGLDDRDPMLKDRLLQCLNRLYALEPAPGAYVIHGDGRFELYSCGVVDTTLGLDDVEVLTTVQKWVPYVLDFQERVLTLFEG